MKKSISFLLASVLALGTTAAFVGCGGSAEYTLNVCNWAEYIDEGGKDGYVYESTGVKSKALYRDFETWYEEQTGHTVHVNYSTFETNEELYNKMKLGNTYDLICPSDYMFEKLYAENLLEPLSDSFFDTSVETNYYAKNLSSYIKGIFDTNTTNGTPWSKYAIGYMWDTTGLLYNPANASAEDMTTWSVLTNAKYKNKITTKDNVRDSYFAALAIYHEDEIKDLNQLYANGSLSLAEYRVALTALMNDTSDTAIAACETILKQVKSNIYSFETDTGKSDLVTGKIAVNFAWSGDAVYAMDLAEEDDVYLEYAIPETASNLFFDGWVMPKGSQTELAEMFMNYISKPENAVRNMYYIGYTSVIAGNEVFDYVSDCYSVETDDDGVDYDLSYFFGDGATLTVSEDQLYRQLLAQYPTEEDLARCVVMAYYDTATNEKLNNMWTNIKG